MGKDIMYLLRYVYARIKNVHFVCNFNFTVETKGLLKVTGNNVMLQKW